MKDLFLFSSLLDASDTFSYFFHIGLVALMANSHKILKLMSKIKFC